MKEGALDLIATWTAIAQGFAVLFGAALAVLICFAAWVVIQLGRLAGDRIGASFARAHQTVADIQQDRKETP